MNRKRRYYVYIMASRSLNLYTGVTDDIFRRALEHKGGTIEGFTKRYNINRLVYYETFRYISNAIAREKRIKTWTRAKRLALIKGMNPTWQDFAEGWGEKVKLQIPRSSTPASQNPGSPGTPVTRDDNREDDSRQYDLKGLLVNKIGTTKTAVRQPARQKNILFKTFQQRTNYGDNNTPRN